MLDRPSFQSYRTPVGDDEYLLEPGWRDWSAGLLRNRYLLDRNQTEFAGRSLGDWRSSTKLAAIQLAREYSASYAPISPTPFREGSAEGESLPSVLVSGHQPELFHPGVWFKNFLLSEFHHQAGAASLNVLIDHDLCRSLTLKTITKDGEGRLRSDLLEIDKLSHAVPWEKLDVNPKTSWSDFPDRVLNHLRPLGIDDPLVLDLWKGMQDLDLARIPPGHWFAVARHRLELEHGVDNLEVPFSRLCQLESFGAFFWQVIDDIDRFWQIYNRCRSVYRSYHRIRNQAHPVPALESEGEWIETPFWIYSKDRPIRRALWCRRQGRVVELSDREGWTHHVDLGSEGAERWELIQELTRLDICVRPRALTTTMYLRLFVADLFLHGIGGGKYDQLTDLILGEWLGWKEVPIFAVASATHRLGIDLPGRDLPTVPSIRRNWWHDRYHAESLLHRPSTLEGNESNWPRHAGSVDELQRLHEVKSQLLRRIPVRGQKYAWHQEMTEVNRKMERLIEPHLQRLMATLPDAELQDRQRGLAWSREYSMALHSKARLIPAMQQMSTRASSDGTPPTDRQSEGSRVHDEPSRY